MDAVFRFQDVTLVRDGRIILDHISLEILPGEICTIIGLSGAGKSTLLSLFNRLQDPNRGEIFFQDRPLTQIDVLKLRRKVGMVFQLPSLFKGTVADNINFGPSLKSDKPVPKDNALPYLQMVGLEPEFLRLPADKLSVGQQQRISIARCLANKPEVLLMDEPTSALDTEAVSTIEELCVELHRKMDLTLVWVTHNLDQARRLGGKTILLDAGVIVKTGAAEEVIARMQADHNRVSPAVLEYLQDDQAGPDE